MPMSMRPPEIRFSVPASCRHRGIAHHRVGDTLPEAQRSVLTPSGSTMDRGSCQRMWDRRTNQRCSGRLCLTGQIHDAAWGCRPEVMANSSIGFSIFHPKMEPFRKHSAEGAEIFPVTTTSSGAPGSVRPVFPDTYIQISTVPSIAVPHHAWHLCPTHSTHAKRLSLSGLNPCAHRIDALARFFRWMLVSIRWNDQLAKPASGGSGCTERSLPCRA